MIIIYIDIILLVILLLLILSACVYCVYWVYRVHSLQRTGRVAILLRPTKVLFSHRKEGDSAEQLRTVVAYQNPFTGDYCVHKSRVGPKGYVNSALTPDSPDSGVSDEYEPLNLVQPPQPHLQEQSQNLVTFLQARRFTMTAFCKLFSLKTRHPCKVPGDIKLPMTPVYDNSVNKTWRWEYTEYQI